MLRNWLGLPPGPWPLDHYTLLGLPAGSGDPREIEPLVLARMERLRQHQLLHPELVTEGMNRLAQALICLTDPASRASYDADLGLAPTVKVDKADRAATESDDLESRAYRLIRDDEPRVVHKEKVVEAELVSPPIPPWQPRRKRDLYQRLARIRWLLSAWEKLKTVVGNPSETLDDRPAIALLFLLGVEEVRPIIGSLPEVFGVPGRPGGLVGAFLGESFLLQAIRLLPMDQRQALAIDWRRGDQALREERFRLREWIETHRLKRRRSRRLRFARRLFLWLIRTPELLLVVLAAAIGIRMWILWRRQL